jgi:D-glycerate 3-kinase
VRGNAGTHDLALGSATLGALRGANSGNGAAAVSVPRYDKSQNGGRGDRAEPAAWPAVQGPLDIVLFEGWMLGFRPVPDADAQQVFSATRSTRLCSSASSEAS